MTIGRSSQGSFGYAQSGLLGVHRDSTKWIALNEPPTYDKQITQIDARLFTPGAYHRSIERMQGIFTVTGSFVMALHPSEGIEFLKGVLSDVTSTELTGAGSGISEHEFIGENTIPMTKGFSITEDMDLKAKYISGAVVTMIEMGAEVNGVVLATVSYIAKKLETAVAGTSGTSKGGTAISFPATIVLDTSDQIKLAINGGAAVEVTITAGAYSTAAALEAAVNTAILGTSGLEDSDGEPGVACYIDSDDKINFYSADKGTGAEITWTAGTNDANTILGYGTPVEAAGTDSLPSESYSSVKPFTATDLTILQDSTEICAESFTLTIDAKIVPRNCFGSKYMKEPKLDGKREVTIAFKKDYEDETQVDAWIANTDVEFEGNFRTGVEIVADSGVEYDADLYLKKCRINNTPEPVYNAAGSITQETTATSFYKDATYVDCKFDVNNTMSSI